MLNPFKYIIVGAGFAGSVIAEQIANVLKEKVLVIEKRSHIGGNCYDYRDKNGIIIHRYGPHLFHTNNKEVFSYLSQFTDWDIYNHKVLAFIDGKKIPIPFNFNSIEALFPESLAKKLIDKLLQKYRYGSKVPILELKKDDDEDIKFLANFVYEKVFKNYTAKQWNKKPEEIDPEVTARVPVFIGRDDRYFNDKYQAVPTEGYTKIFERMLNNENIKLLLNTDYQEVLNIDFERKKVYVLGNEFKGKLIFTGMIDQLFNYRYGELPYRTLNLKFETIEKKYFQEVATVNYPNNYDFTRITEFKHIHPVEVEKTVILKEFPKEYRKGDIPYYPVFTPENREMYNKYRELVSEFKNIIAVGRLADYRYYDMDDIVEKALKVFREEVA